MGGDTSHRRLAERLLEEYRKRVAARGPSVYCDHYYARSGDLRSTGVLQTEDKCRLDRVLLAAPNCGELVHLFGFGQNDGSHFRLTLTVAPLAGPGSRWSLGRVHLMLCLPACGRGDGPPANEPAASAGPMCVYEYEQEQLLDYEAKRRASEAHENRNVYRVGCLSLETVLANSLSRLLFNGMMRVRTLDDAPHDHQRAAARSRPMKLTISTHPTCDKFYYPERYEPEHQLEVIAKSLGSAGRAQAPPPSLLPLLLPDDRVDQPLMFQGSLEQLDGDCGDREGDRNAENQPTTTTTTTTTATDFVMWGAKVKLRPDAAAATETSAAHDCLFAWSQCGQQVHLARPAGLPLFVSGLVHSSYDYASPLYEAKLYKRTGPAGELAPLEFDELASFAQLTSAHVIKVRAFKVKEYTLEFLEPSGAGAGAESQPNSDQDQDQDQQQQRRRRRRRRRGPWTIKLNGFEGWAASELLQLADAARCAREKLLTLNLHERLFTPRLADESLLGGKGHSLVQLAALLEESEARAGPLADTLRSLGCLGVSVPRGLVVTAEAYREWLASCGAELASALRALNARRLALAAASVHLDPMSSAHVAPVEAKRRLGELCASTRARLLEACPLPGSVRNALRAQLEAIFGPFPGGSDEQPRAGQLFAVRSSCVGEDSLETSAAGQLRTILDASSFSSICRAVVACWLSQFELEALTYKSQNGLAFNLPMAVVVQELVGCDAAGVGATCDPLTGNRARLEITANPGQGEGVVGGRLTDTVRVRLACGLEPSWSAREDDYAASVSLHEQNCALEELPGTGEGRVCLSRAQSFALANLLLSMRRSAASRAQPAEREVEWGVTLEEGAGDGAAHFRVHLFQSRPLTHLNRLSARELDHELDSGLPSPLDLVSRANLGEVMPGAMCPLFSTWLIPVTSAMTSQKPYEARHSRQIFVADNFAYHARIITLVVTYGEALTRFGPAHGKPTTGPAAADNNENNNNNNIKDDEEDSTARNIIYSMIGSTFEEPANEEERRARERFVGEKVSPLAPAQRRSFLGVLASDALLGAHMLRAKRSLSATLLEDDLTPLERLGAELASAQDDAERTARVERKICAEARELLERLLTRTRGLSLAWMAHILATVTSMAFNAMTLKLMCAQPSYQGQSMIASEVLNDFSVLMRGKARDERAASSSDQGKKRTTTTKTKKKEKERKHKTTESGDISKLIERLLESLAAEGALERARQLDAKQLHEFLNSEENARTLDACALYARFMRKNGHRAFKEFDFATRSWSDDQSYIVRLLATRLQSYSGAGGETETARAKAERLAAEAQARELARVDAKLTRNRWLLRGVALRRARNATIRREATKSLIIASVHKYRLAFRHLGGLLCLAGLLPDAQLIFYLALEEIDEIVRRCCASSGTGTGAPETDASARADLMPRLLYKARRRQQRTRAYDLVRFPRPTISVTEMLATIREQTSGKTDARPPAAARGPGEGQPPPPANGSGAGQVPTARVTGITACTGRVTGRACVLQSLDQVDQLQQNDILVTYSTDISWSVHFYQLAGIVTEVGGIVSHGAVVAREYGLPTLCTAVGACSAFRTGQLITLDASRGVCYALANGDGPSDARQPES